MRGGATSLASADSSYYIVRAPYSGTLSWYGTFPVSATASNFKATFTGYASKACTFDLAIYRWTTATWETMGSQATIETGTTTVADQAPSASVPASELMSSSHQVRVKVTCSASMSFYRWALSADMLKLSYTP